MRSHGPSRSFKQATTGLICGRNMEKSNQMKLKFYFCGAHASISGMYAHCSAMRSSKIARLAGSRTYTQSGSSPGNMRHLWSSIFCSMVNASLMRGAVYWRKYPGHEKGGGTLSFLPLKYHNVPATRRKADKTAIPCLHQVSIIELSVIQ